MKRVILFFILLVMLSPLLAQRNETTVLEVAGELATPIKVITNNGTYNVYSVKVINGAINVREAYDANGKQIVVPNGDYKSTSTNGKSEYKRIYRFKILYGNNRSSYGTNKSTYNNERNYNRNSSSFGLFEGTWINSSDRVLNVLSINAISDNIYNITSYTYLEGELLHTNQNQAILNTEGFLEENVSIRRTYDNAIRYTNSIYEVKGNTLIQHSKYKTDFYSDSNFLNYKYTGEKGSKDWFYQRE